MEFRRKQDRAVFPPGTAEVTWQAGKVVRVRFVRTRGQSAGNGRLARRLLSVLHGGVPVELEFSLEGLPGFTRRVLRACSWIPAGDVRSYGQLAAKVGKPGAARAVGQALARNPVPVLVPCHRVVRAGGQLGGFGGGRVWKEFLLAQEGWAFEGQGANRRLARNDGRNRG